MSDIPDTDVDLNDIPAPATRALTTFRGGTRTFINASYGRSAYAWHQPPMPQDSGPLFPAALRQLQQKCSPHDAHTIDGFPPLPSATDSHSTTANIPTTPIALRDISFSSPATPSCSSPPSSYQSRVFNQQLPSSELYQASNNLIPSRISNKLSYSQPIEFPNPVRYIIIQAFTQRWTAALLPEQSKQIMSTAPVLLRIDEDAGIQFSNISRRLARHNNAPQLLDEIDVYAYAMVYVEGQALPFQSFQDTDISNVLGFDSAKPTAIVAAGTIDLEVRPRPREILTVIQICTANRPRSQQRPTLQFVSRYHESQMQLREYQLDFTYCTNPPPGSFARSLQLVLDPGMQIGSNFVLPRHYRPQQKARYITEEEKFSYVIKLTPLAPNDHTVLPNPLNSTTRDNIRSIMCEYEDVLLATSAFMQNRQRTAFEITAYIGEDHTFDGNFIHLQITPSDDPRIAVTRNKLWERHCRMVFKVTDPSAKRPVIHDYSLPTTPPQAIGKLTQVNIEDDGTIKAMLYFDDEQLRIAVELTEEAHLQEKLIKIHPDPYSTGYEFRLERFRYRELTRAVSDPPPTPHQSIIRSLMGIENTAQRSTQEILTNAPSLQTNTPLNPPQIAVIQTLLAGVPVLYQQAPAGTGKTYVIAAYVAKICNTLADDDMILLTAFTNLSVINIASAVLQLATTGPHDLLSLQSLMAERTYPRHNDVSNNPWTQHRVPERLHSQCSANELTDEDLDFASHYVSYRLTHRGQPYDEVRATRVSVQATPPKLVFGTVAMLELRARRFCLNVSHLVCDEVGSIPESQLLALVSSIRRLRQLFLTGDAKRLSAYRANVPDRIVPYGLRGAVESISDRNVIPILSLKHNFRSHPYLTLYLSHAAYNGELTSPLLPIQRPLLVDSDFPLPVQHVPLLLLHAPGTSLQDIYHSRHNPEQESIVEKLVWRLHQSVKASSVVILCFYLGTKRMITRSMEIPENCEVHTVDYFKGREADIVILITTRSSNILDDNDESLQFFLHDQRITVALSRARQGLLIVGDFCLLRKNEIWKRYLTQATLMTPVVGTNYMESLNSTIQQRSESVLLTPDGRSTVSTANIPENARWRFIINRIQSTSDQQR